MTTYIILFPSHLSHDQMTEKICFICSVITISPKKKIFPDYHVDILQEVFDSFSRVLTYLLNLLPYLKILILTLK